MNDLLLMALVYGGFFTMLCTFLFWVYGSVTTTEAIRLFFNPPMPLKNWFNIRTFVTFVAGIVLAVNVNNHMHRSPPDSFTITGGGNRLTGELTSLRVVGGALSNNHEGTDADLSESFKIAEEFSNGTLAIFWVIKTDQDGLK